MASLDDVACFVQVADRGSFTAAAARLGMSPSAASKLVTALEQRLGVRLLHRTTRRLSLTEAGEVFYASAQRGLQEIAQAEAAVSTLQSAPRGTLRLNVPMSFGILELAPALGGFLARHPEIQIDMRLDDRKLDLVAEGFDVAIRIGELPDSSLVARALCPAPHVVCATPAYLKRHGEPRVPDDLRKHNALTFNYADAPSQWEFTARYGSVIRVPVSGSMRMNNSLALRAALLDDLGITLTPRFVVENDLRDGRLRAVLADYRVRQPSVYAVYPARQHLTPKVRAFVEFAAELLTARPGAKARAKAARR
jgi:DNA-binding transcriptional LysR family regulator